MRRIGQYDILFSLYTGGLGDIFVGRAQGLAGSDGLVAIKVIHPHLCAGDDFVDIFLNEARLASGVRHANVCEVFEVDTDGDHPFVICELIKGQSLSAVLETAAKRNEPFPWEFAADIATQTAKGLHAIHELRSDRGAPLGLVHKNVSPDNILISYDGRIKLIDFGVAYARKLLSKAPRGSPKGKAGYMAPELLLGRPIDRRCDIFSLGAVLYLMLTRQPAFPGAVETERMRRVLSNGLVPAEQLKPDLPDTLGYILDRCLAHEPRTRFANAAVFCSEIETFCASQGASVPTGELTDLMHRLFAAQIQSLKTRIITGARSLDRPSSPPPPSRK